MVSESSVKARSPPPASISEDIEYFSGCSVRTLPYQAELADRPSHHLHGHLLHDRTPNLNAAANARFCRVGCVAGGGNLRDRSAGGFLFGPGFNFGLQGDRAGQPGRCCHLHLRLHLKDAVQLRQ